MRLLRVALLPFCFHFGWLCRCCLHIRRLHLVRLTLPLGYVSTGVHSCVFGFARADPFVDRRGCRDFLFGFVLVMLMRLPLLFWLCVRFWVLRHTNLMTANPLF